MDDTDQQVVQASNQSYSGQDAQASNQSNSGQGAQASNQFEDEQADDEADVASNHPTPPRRRVQRGRCDICRLPKTLFHTGLSRDNCIQHIRIRAKRKCVLDKKEWCRAKKYRTHP